MFKLYTSNLIALTDSSMKLFDENGKFIKSINFHENRVPDIYNFYSRTAFGNNLVLMSPKCIIIDSLLNNQPDIIFKKINPNSALLISFLHGNLLIYEKPFSKFFNYASAQVIDLKLKENIIFNNDYFNTQMENIKHISNFEFNDVDIRFISNDFIYYEPTTQGLEAQITLIACSIHSNNTQEITLERASQIQNFSIDFVFMKKGSSQNNKPYLLAVDLKKRDYFPIKTFEFFRQDGSYYYFDFKDKILIYNVINPSFYEIKSCNKIDIDCIEDIFFEINNLKVTLKLKNAYNLESFNSSQVYLKDFIYQGYINLLERGILP